MTWTPISGTVPQYSTSSNALADDYYLKFYASGTTTPINMATDSTGTAQLAECKLSSDGYPVTNPLDDATKFIPHIDKNYRIVLYKSKADADADNTSAAAFNIDGLAPIVAPSADASDIALRDTTVEAQDDYDRSPLLVDGEDFTAGAGPHTITVPSDWNPTRADMRFYRLDASGIVTPLTPTATSSTTFTLAETLLSTDVIFIGDDTFRKQFGGDPADIRERLDVKTDAENDTRYLNESSNLSDLDSAATARANLSVYSKSEIDKKVFTSSIQVTSDSGSDSFNVPDYFRDKFFQLDIIWTSAFANPGVQTLINAGAVARFKNSLTNGRGATSASYGAATLPAVPSSENTVNYNWNGTAINSSFRVAIVFVFREI